jgi:DNA-binding NarL/FixJ family response regulator
MPESRLPYVQTLIEEIGIEGLTAIEVEAVRTRPIPHRLAEALARDPDRRGLSPHELRILRLQAEGMTRPEIADALGKSVETIRSAVKSMHRKLETRTGPQTVVRAIQSGYLQV